MPKLRKNYRSMPQTYSFYDERNGGVSCAEMLRILKGNGIDCERTHSIYVGHAAVRVWGGERVQRKAGRLIYGR